jgi:DNA-binding MarR family transcriptional regulator
VQRIVHELAAEGYVALAPNPHHRRASLVVLTAKGRTAFAAVDRLQTPWVNALAKGMGVEDIAAAREIIAKLRTRLDDAGLEAATAAPSRPKR